MLILVVIFLTLFVLIIFKKIGSFRKPTGKYDVGMTEYHWIDASRKELNNELGDTYRELMAYVCYPAVNKSKNPVTPYDKDALARQKSFVHLKSKIPAILLKGWDSIKTYAQHNASAAPSKYPVIITSNSAGTMVQHYTWLLEELASQGYIVIGINHPYMAAITTFPDGRILKSLIAQMKNLNRNLYESWKQEQTNTCVADIDFVVKQLETLNRSGLLQGKLDLEHVGIAGHSFAGDIALLAGSANKQIQAIVNMDGGERVFRYNKIQEPFNVPCLMIIAQKSHQWSDDKGVNALKALDIFCNAHKRNVSKVTLPNAGHGVFGDLPILLNSTLFTRIASYFFDFDLDTSASKGCKAINKVSVYLVNFFDKHLK